MCEVKDMMSRREREVRLKERKGGQYHSVTKLVSISELLDGNRKPNVKFCRATVVTSIVPASNTSSTAQRVRSDNNNNKTLTIFFSL
jgi:hypothetical protein